MDAPTNKAVNKTTMDQAIDQLVIAPDKYERKKMESKARIKEAAMVLFSEKGIEATSVASIVREADIAHKTFFNHFPSKRHLLHDIAEDVTKVAYAIFAEVDSLNVEPKEKLSIAFIKIAKGMEEFTPGQKELVNYCLIGIPETTDALTAQQAVKMQTSVDKILKEAKKNNQLNTEFPYPVLLDMTLGIFTSTLTNWAMQDDFPLQKKIRQAVKFIEYSVFANK